LPEDRQPVGFGRTSLGSQAAKLERFITHTNCQADNVVRRISKTPLIAEADVDAACLRASCDLA
jgi:hypothetical protein